MTFPVGQWVSELAAGAMAREAIADLQRSRVSRTMLLLSRLGREHPGLRAPVELIAAAQDSQPARVGELLAWPWAGVWAAATVRSVDHPGPVGTYLRGLAVAAARLAGLPPGELPVPVAPGDGVMLPMLGAVTDLGGRPCLTWPAAPRPEGWLPLRRLVATHRGQRLTVLLDDLDPYRRWDGLPVSPRLTVAQVGGWQRLLQAAWVKLVDYAPAWADELQAGLVSLVPLRDAGSGLSLSATHRESFGGLAASWHRDASVFAATLVHEFQHSKLNQLMNHARLHDADPDRRYASPWRREPRPLHGLLQGVYAFVAVAELWDAFRNDPTQLDAGRNVVAAADQLRQAMSTIDDSRMLNADGRRLVAGVAARLEALTSRRGRPRRNT